MDILSRLTYTVYVTRKYIPLISSRARRTKDTRKARKRPALTREGVLAGALIILDRDGLDALSMRRLAADLRVSPMALYNHVRSRQDLLEGVVRNLIDRVDFSSEDPDWRARIRTCFRALRNACLAHPCVVRLTEMIETLPPSIFRPMEITTAALEHIGADPRDALRGYFLLTNFTLGQVSYEVRGPFVGLDPTEALRSRRIDRVSFPHVERAASIGGWDFGHAFEFGISVILAGLAQRYITDVPIT
jgi:TetR/AcrR family tetracycline transcriptional repressor